MNALNGFVLHPYVMGVCAGVQAGLCESGFAGLGENTARRVCELAGINNINYLECMVPSEVVEACMDTYLRAGRVVRRHLLDGMLSVEGIGFGQADSEKNLMSAELCNLTAFYGLQPVSL